MYWSFRSDTFKILSNISRPLFLHIRLKDPSVYSQQSGTGIEFAFVHICACVTFAVASRYKLELGNWNPESSYKSGKSINMGSALLSGWFDICLAWTCFCLRQSANNSIQLPSSLKERPKNIFFSPS